MKAKAKHWVNYNGVWHMTGEVFNIDPADVDEMKLYADVMGDALATNETEQEELISEEPAKRGRKRKAE